MVKTIIRKYRNVFHVLSTQGLDILKYIYCYVPKHPELFKQLSKFKDIHKNDRCFIVATGPSLTIEDVNKLKGEICFACNSCIRLFDKTDWRPNYYAIGDGTVFEKIKDDLLKTQLDCAFYNHKDIVWEGENIYPLPMWVSLFMDQSTRNAIPKIFRKKRMSMDITKKVYMGGNITNIIIQICFYMGFKEIYLLGCDCNYFDPQAHSGVANYDADPTLQERAEFIYQTMIDDHKCAKQTSEKLGVKIYNATRGGMLEVYPRVNLDDVLSSN